MQKDKEEDNNIPEKKPKIEEGEEGDLSLPSELQKKHVYEVYDKIAPHFSHTRYKPWPKIEKFLKQLEPGSMVYDVGCGNGKYMGVNPSLFMIGTDRSIGLLKTAQEKGDDFQLFSADSLYLPLRSETCDAFISIAVVHHFSTDEQRLRALKELIRITRIGGVGLVYVWAFEQDLQG